MGSLRQLSGLFLLTASAFTVAIALQDHPALKRGVEATASFTRVHGAEAVIALNDDVIQPGWKFTRAESVALGQKIAAEFAPSPVKVAPVRLARAVPHPIPRPEMHVAKLAPPAPAHINSPAPQVALTSPVLTAPPVETAPPALRPSVPETTPQPSQTPEVATLLPQKPMVLAPQAATLTPAPSVTPETATPVPNLPAPSPAELVRVEQRLKDSLTSEMLANFELFLYVSKADSGPWSQRMFVFQKQASGDLVLLDNWPVSTGREKIEFNPAGAKLPSFTPAGYYELDPKRFYSHYRSVQWDQPMPYAMFFNWVKDGNQTGLAIHAATGDDIGLLGSRASAGCIRLAPEPARQLFSLIRSQYRGLAPRFAMDRRTGTMSNEGILLHDPSGKVQLAEGYKVLVFVENYGGENVVAALF
ncbi:MAG: L,D-transpeptidase family protein [Rhizomicrobium sp.]|jgi:lipoprotein-anchoring transpeptidase ErfK/SrfK